MPQCYSSKDAGLPAFYTSTTSSLQRFNNYKLILKACLVSGYGTRPAAGWTLIDEGDQYLVLRNAAGNYVSITSGYYVVNTNLQFHGVFRVFLHATYTGMGANGIPQGQGVVSGTSGSTTLPVLFGTDLFYWNTNTRWIMVADSRTFIFTIAAYTGATSGTGLDTASGVGTLYVGDDLGGNHIAAGGNRQSGINTPQLALYFDRIAFTTLRNPRTGLLVDTAGITAFLDGSYADAAVISNHVSSSGISILNPGSITDMLSLEMGQVRWSGGGAPQPGLRGIRRENLMSRYYSNLVRRQLEGASTTVDYTSENILNFTPLSDGYCYLPLMAQTGGRCALITTDNPAYW
ncbi:Uncharacterised protein [Aquipseudomonas alcaligenes]|uniref:Uncharacterized protein n=1 Tax=Aquipseudomonas alcaligenes (strain ATCC 14909 / DSM 50342 / CCUG 1425 / JCM 20561 / NBRC 14159 / NCIMB 9945 / NCTC 10367 / 1577) TaxID=1215092 RepID=U2Z4F3_AQUA1|nr:hypothetical protein PA6_014_00140 [Pseudomonas alcaligenes NBRC 14159]SUD18177.1 Uncharacterised protein [Pseudomonas alcaligenes]